MTAVIRPYEAGDEVAVAEVWYRAGRSTYTFLPAWRNFKLEEARAVFRQVIVPDCDIWVASEGGRVVAYLALQSTYIDRLYVDPAKQRCGWGTRLIEHAKTLQPDGLELHTHQENRGACAFYERHGFVAAKFGVSPPPESSPDVEYHWRPANQEANG